MEQANRKIPLDETRINLLLKETVGTGIDKAKAILAAARNGRKPTLTEIATLIHRAIDIENGLFEAAAEIKQTIYGNRIILFAPFYLSNYCANDCGYCGFRLSNSEAARTVLSREEAIEGVRQLHRRGYRRLLLESAENSQALPIDELCTIMRDIYNLKDARGRPIIDRLNVNIAATTEENFRKLLGANIGTYNLFQETYHRETYEAIHPRGPKHNYERQFFAHDIAISAGIGDVGLGVLYGLYDWKFELLAQIIHARYLEEAYGIGPHTISFPRIKSAQGVKFTPPAAVNDAEYLRIIALSRIAVPYAGLVISTRETAALRRKAFRIGISQTSAGSSTKVGGYHHNQDDDNEGQFALADHRPLEQVVRELLEDGFIPAFCTACEYRGRQGSIFMQFAKTGCIGPLCTANSLLSLAEYLRDATEHGFLDAATIELGKKIIREKLFETNPFARGFLEESAKRIFDGENARNHYI